MADLFAEAERQLRVCNACRYCEGYCAVFPSLERRDVLGEGDITQIANLCHDCRACFHACMYAPPHQFAINIPEVLSQVRVSTYDELVSRGESTRRFRGLLRWGLVIVALAVLLIVLVGAIRGSHALFPGSGAAMSPYSVVAFPLLLALVLAPCVWSGYVVVRAAVRYWRAVDGSLRTLLDVNALWRAVRYAAELRYLRGGGDECYFPEDDPSATRRILHNLIAYGTLSAFVSTVSAAFEQHILGIEPPYPYASVPVLTGLIGGIAMSIGCTGLLVVRRKRDRGLEAADMSRRGTALIVALDALAVSGLLTLFTRNTAAFGIILAVHLATIVVCFAILPYSKFMHVLYRFLAIVRDNREMQAQRTPATR